MTHRSALLTIALTAAAVSHPTADTARLRATVETLASERFGGRMTGSEGEGLARQFIISELQRIGAKPLPGVDGFETPFEFTAVTLDFGSNMGISISLPPRDGVTSSFVPGPGPGTSARALSFSDNGDAEGLENLLNEREQLLQARDKLIQNLMTELKDKKTQLARQEIEVWQKIERREAWKHRLSKFGIRLKD